jgi:hypothetical protein
MSFHLENEVLKEWVIESFFLIFFCFVIFFSMNSFASDVIFYESFESQATINIKGKCRFEGDINDDNLDLIEDCLQTPTGWDFVYTGDRNLSNPPAEIISSPESKILRVYDESYGDANSWGHDFQLGKHFDQYPELWISLYIRFNSNLDRTNLNAAKIFRMGHYNPKVVDGTTKTSVVNTNLVTSEGPTVSALLFYDIKKVRDDWYRHKLSFRGDPSYKIASKFNGPQFEFMNKNGEFADKSWSATYGDGKWHQFEIGMNMNSAADIKDGQVHFYLDGVLQKSFTDIPWLQTGHNVGVSGFNMITVGGNADFLWDDQNESEQYFYDIDNITICTSRCPKPNPPSNLTLR